MDEIRISRISPAGDGFYAAAKCRQDEEEPAPHCCYEGWVYLGFETEEDGEIIEITDRLPCRRCGQEGSE